VITKIDTDNFKAFPTLSVQLRPITLFLGPNNSGKTSIIAPLRLLAQTLGNADPAVPLLFDGPFGDFGTYRDCVYLNHRGRPMSIALEVGGEDSEITARLAAEFKYRTVRRELVVREASLESPPGIHLITLTLSSEGDRHLVTRLNGRPIPPAYRSRASEMARLYTFIPRSLFFPWRYRREGETWALAELLSVDEYDKLDDALENASLAISQALSTVDYVGAMRQPPERTYHQTGAARTRIGSSGENWAGLFVLDSSRPATRRTIVPRLTAWLKQAGLASDIRLNWLSDRHYEIQLQHPLSGEYQNLADVGQANSQVIPVVVGGLRLPPESTYIMEEPEIHLHPAAQAELGDFLLDLRSRGIQAVVETHSEYLLLRLQQHVAAGRLSPDDVVFYYVDTTAAGKRVRELELDSKARFKEQLDGGFFPQRLDEATMLARLRG